MSEVKPQVPRGNACDRVRELFLTGWCGTLAETARRTGLSQSTIRSVFRQLDRERIACVVETREVTIRLRPYQPARVVVAKVWGAAVSAQKTEAFASPRRSPSLVRALRAVEHLPRWMGGQGLP